MIISLAYEAILLLPLFKFGLTLAALSVVEWNSSVTIWTGVLFKLLLHKCSEAMLLNKKAFFHSSAYSRPCNTCHRAQRKPVQSFEAFSWLYLGWISPLDRRLALAAIITGLRPVDFPLEVFLFGNLLCLSSCRRTSHSRINSFTRPYWKYIPTGACAGQSSLSLYRTAVSSDTFVLPGLLTSWNRRIAPSSNRWHCESFFYCTRILYIQKLLDGLL